MTGSARTLSRGSGSRIRAIRGGVFCVACAGALLAGLVVLVVVLFTTLREATGLRAMHATAEAGLSLSLRSMTGDGGSTQPYVMVSQIEEGSHAATVGIQQGDALVGMAAEPVRSTAALWQQIDRLDPQGTALEVSWVPRAEELLGELVPRQRPGAPPGTFDILVDWIPPESPAATAGLESADVLLRVADTNVTGTHQAWEAIVVAARDRPGSVTLRIKRGTQELDVALPAARTGELVMSCSLLRAFWAFATRLDEPRYPEHAGIASAILGSLFVILITAIIAFPLGIGAAIYLEEYASRNVLTEGLEILITNLAGIPSVIYGILGLEVLARSLDLGRSIVAGGMTLALLILPVMILTSREALRAVPQTIRQAAFAAGATRWQVVRHQVLPPALPGMLTAMILSLSRAIGEAAPLILLGAFLYVTYLPSSLMDSFTVLPLQIFSWATKPQAGYETLAAAAIVILVALLLCLNAAAIFFRGRYQSRW